MRAAFVKFNSIHAPDLVHILFISNPALPKHQLRFVSKTFHHGYSLFLRQDVLIDG